MSFKRKGAPTLKSLDDPEGTAQSDQRRAGNSGYDINNPDLCYSSGVSPVNSKGQVTDKQGKIMNWPFQRSTIDNELNPRSNQGKPDQLSGSPQAYGDYSTADGKSVVAPDRQTLG